MSQAAHRSVVASFGDLSLMRNLANHILSLILLMVISDLSYSIFL